MSYREDREGLSMLAWVESGHGKVAASALTCCITGSVRGGQGNNKYATTTPCWLLHATGRRPPRPNNTGQRDVFATYPRCVRYLSIMCAHIYYSKPCLRAHSDSLSLAPERLRQHPIISSSLSLKNGSHSGQQASHKCLVNSLLPGSGGHANGFPMKHPPRMRHKKQEGQRSEQLCLPPAIPTCSSCPC